MMKTNRTFLPVSIATNSEHRRGDQIEQARNQIQAASFYLQSLFNSVKHVASHLETEVEDHLQETCCDLQCLAEIGYSVSNSIFAAVSELDTALEETSINTDAASEVDKPDAYDYRTLDEADINTLALALSEILNNPNLPRDIYDGIQDAICDIYSETDSTDPEHIAKALRGYKREREANDE